MFYNKIFGCGDFDGVLNPLTWFTLWNVYFTLVKSVLIYLNSLCCFHVLCYMFVLLFGNSPEDYSIFFWGVTCTQSYLFTHQFQLLMAHKYITGSMGVLLLDFRILVGSRVGIPLYVILSWVCSVSYSFFSQRSSYPNIHVPIHPYIRIPIRVWG